MNNYRIEIENKLFEDCIKLKIKIFWFWLTVKRIEFVGVNYKGRKDDVQKTVTWLVIKYNIPSNQIIIYAN